MLPDIAAQLSEAETIADAAERQQKKDELMQNYAVKAERVPYRHIVLLKAYTPLWRRMWNM